MIAALAQSLARRNRRERWLLAILLAVVVPVAFVALVALPLLEQRAAAHRALTDAQATQAWYVARQHEIAALPSTERASPDLAETAITPIGLGGIEARLIDADLRNAVTLLANTQGDSVSLTLNAVEFSALMAWIDSIEDNAGYRLTALRLERGVDAGLVTAELRLEPQR